MHIKINDKSILDCEEEDFRSILNDPSYRESQYIDYKETFSFINSDTETKTAKINEFRKDICSFANAEGGFLIYGIREEQGIPVEIKGVRIDDTDKFELELRNKLSSIMPKAPTVTIKTIPLESNDYIVLIFISNDYYAPYIFIVDQKYYIIYKRNGNGNNPISYTELRSMYLKARVLEEEIYNYRVGRINYFSNEVDYSNKGFVIFHLIPESFLEEKKQLFLFEKKTGHSLGKVFMMTNILSQLSIPCVDGLRYGTDSYSDDSATLYNNGIAEYFMPLEKYKKDYRGKWYLSYKGIWENIESVTQGYRDEMISFFGRQRYYGCISIIGGKGIYVKNDFDGISISSLDRNRIVCSPVMFGDISNEDNYSLEVDKMRLEYVLSLGINKGRDLKELIDRINQKEL